MEKKKGSFFSNLRIAVPKLVIKTEPDPINLSKLRDSIATDMPVELISENSNTPWYIEDSPYFSDYEPKLEQSNR